MIVDCDLGRVDMAGMEQLPPPVRRSLTKATRAVLHSNLGSLDTPVRLSKPEVSASTAAAAAAAAALAKAGTAGVATKSKGGASSSASGGGGGVTDLGRTVGRVGLSAWTDRDVSSGGGSGGSSSKHAGQGGGEKSAEAGDSSSWRGRRRSGAGVSGSGGGAEGEVVARKARRGRARGAEARMEALLRLEFARAMADMLYGFTECLFFLHPDRPIFNGARFLQVRWRLLLFLLWLLSAVLV